MIFGQHQLRLCGTTSLLLAATAAGQSTVPLQPVVVTALRSAGSPASAPFSSRVLDADALRRSPALTLDSALRSLPAFSLFRRSDSLVAHPTAQGVSLRGLGPSGASRSLVLLDGVPLNDPFGGWVAWTKLPREGLAGAEVLSGAGGTAWGNAALGGVVHLFTRQPEGDETSATAMIGGFDTHSLEWQVAKAWTSAGTGGTGNGRQGSLQLGGRWFETEGYRVVAAEDRGRIDTPAGNEHRVVSARWVQPLADELTATVMARWFREERANGTPYLRNDSEEAFVSAQLSAQTGSVFAWNAVIYAQDQTFASTFSSVAPDRNTETPASNQYDVPADAFGAAWTGEWRTSDNARTVVGADLRSVRGESREHFTYSNGQFTRERAAGGRQLVAGLFALHERTFAHGIVAAAGLRGDHWRESDGFRAEREIASGASLRDEQFGQRDGFEISPTLSARGTLAESLGWRVSAQRAFRRPTLNELYRPFRVGNIITEANAGLETETVTTVESALTFARAAFSGEVVVFWNELRDAVGNVTVARGPGTVPGFGFIPAGGLGRRRENLERIRVRGVELSGRWHLLPDLDLTAVALLNEAKVTRAARVPALEGKRLAQVPKTSASLGVEWSGMRGWRASSRARWMGAQFEDDENALRLAPALVVDFSLVRTFEPGWDLFVLIENAFNKRIETGRSSADVINVGTPRFVSGGVRWGW